MKLAIAVASLSLSIATPIFACPMDDHEATRTAEKAKDAPTPETAKADKAKPADKAKAAKPADKAKAAKPADKVSQR
jgi:membrane protein involved in colicin uptake